jgi:dTDP-4-dehydrorhamnose 3,5-epimerase
VQIRELSVPDAYEITPVVLGDDRGIFFEWYRHDLLQEAVGHPLSLRQANTSVSKKGVVRGIHFADVPPGQAKYVTVTRGAIIDYVIDIRLGSPSFGTWDSILLDDVDRRAAYIGEGLGHAFVALTDDTTVSYLTSATYNPAHEHAITPIDDQIGLIFPPELGAPLLSSKDLQAPTLAEAEKLGHLPQFGEVRKWYASLNTVATSALKG